MKYLIALLLSTLFTSHISWGQTGGMLYQWDSPAINDYSHFGSSVSGGGDINGDGYPDVIIANGDLGGQGGLSDHGGAYAYSGADGTTLYEWFGIQHEGHFGSSISHAGDVDGDGFGDIIIGATQEDHNNLVNSGAAYVYSGLDGILLYQWIGETENDYFGNCVSGAGDVNNDGFDDVVVGAWDAEVNAIIDVGSAYVYSGIDGSLIHKFDGQRSLEYFGTSVDAAGDINNDGFADIIIGAYGESQSGLASAGRAYIYSGQNGALLLEWDGQSIGDRFGSSVAGVGDINNDGFSDVAIAAKNADPGGINSAGSVYVYSGQNGSLIRQWDGIQGVDIFGHSIDSAGDFNNDGTLDIIVGAWTADSGGVTNNGSAYIYSGADGALLHQWDGQEQSDRLGSSVAYAGDLNQDGGDDVLISASYTTFGSGNIGKGTVHAFAGTSPYSLTIEPMFSGGTTSINIKDCAANGWLYLCWSLTGNGPTTIGSTNSFVVDLSVPIGSFTPRQLDANGGTTIGPLIIPPGFMPGTQLWIQGVVLDIIGGSGIKITNMVTATVL